MNANYNPTIEALRNSYLESRLVDDSESITLWSLLLGNDDDDDDETFALSSQSDVVADGDDDSDDDDDDDEEDDEDEWPNEGGGMLCLMVPILSFAKYIDSADELLLFVIMFDDNVL